MAIEMTNICLTSSAREAVLIANTPSFLLNRLVMDPSVQEAVDSFTSVELFKYFAETCISGPNSPESLTQLYVALVALGISSEDDIWSSVTLTDTQHVPWAQSLVALLDVNRNSAYSSEELVSSVGTLASVEIDEEIWGEEEIVPSREEQFV
jgi:hypothetical protein